MAIGLWRFMRSCGCRTLFSQSVQLREACIRPFDIPHECRKGQPVCAYAQAVDNRQRHLPAALDILERL